MKKYSHTGHLSGAIRIADGYYVVATDYKKFEDRYTITLDNKSVTFMNDADSSLCGLYSNRATHIELTNPAFVYIMEQFIQADEAVNNRPVGWYEMEDAYNSGELIGMRQAYINCLEHIINSSKQ